MAEPDVPVVLLVDADHQFRYLIERYAQLSGCRLMHAAMEEATPALIARAAPALILIDLLPPGLRAWGLMRTLRGDTRVRAIPVAICGTVEDEARATEEGVDCCLWKPVRYDDFVAALAGVGVLTPMRRVAGGGVERPTIK